MGQRSAEAKDPDSLPVGTRRVRVCMLCTPCRTHPRFEEGWVTTEAEAPKSFNAKGKEICVMCGDLPFYCPQKDSCTETPPPSSTTHQYKPNNIYGNRNSKQKKVTFEGGSRFCCPWTNSKEAERGRDLSIRSKHASTILCNGRFRGGKGFRNSKACKSEPSVGASPSHMWKDCWVRRSRSKESVGMWWP